MASPSIFRPRALASNLRAVPADLRAFLAERRPHQLLFAVLSVCMPALIVTGFYIDAQVKPPKLGVIYAQSWPASRSDAEIIAQQKIDQKKKDAQLEERQRQYQRLADQLGIEY